MNRPAAVFAAATLVLGGGLLVFIVSGREDAPARPGPGAAIEAPTKPGVTATPGDRSDPAKGKPAATPTTPKTFQAPSGTGPEVLTSEDARASFAKLLAANVRDGQFLERKFEGEFARHLFLKPGDTEAAVDFLLEQTDRQKAHAIARGLAGTLVGQDEARRRILDTIRTPPSEMMAEVALYALLASQPKSDAQEVLVEVFTDPNRSEPTRTTAAFVMREGLSAMAEPKREVARGHARRLLTGSYVTESGESSGPPAASPPMRVECLAILGGHLEPSESDLTLLRAAVDQASSLDELQVALAMLIRHKVSKQEILTRLEDRKARAPGKESREMFEELIRQTRAHLAPTKGRPPVSPNPEGPRPAGPPAPGE